MDQTALVTSWNMRRLEQKEKRIAIMKIVQNKVLVPLLETKSQSMFWQTNQKYLEKRCEDPNACHPLIVCDRNYVRLEWEMRFQVSLPLRFKNKYNPDGQIQMHMDHMITVGRTYRWFKRQWVFQWCIRGDCNIISDR